MYSQAFIIYLKFKCDWKTCIFICYQWPCSLNSISLLSWAHSLTPVLSLHCMGTLPEVTTTIPRPGLSKPARSSVMSSPPLYASNSENSVENSRQQGLWSHQTEGAPIPEWLHEGELPTNKCSRNKVTLCPVTEMWRLQQWLVHVTNTGKKNIPPIQLFSSKCVYETPLL